MFKAFLILMLFLNLALASEDVVLKVTSTVGELPPDFLDLNEKPFNLDLDKPFEVVFIMVNDIGFGDDYGHTHGLKIVGATRFEKGIRLKLAYTSDLYSQIIGEENPNGPTPQHFMDENVFKFVLDNLEQGNVSYWKAGLGWQELSNEVTDNPLYASKQQVLFHEFLNLFQSVKSPQNIPEGYGTKDGIMAIGAIGVHDEIQKGNLSLSAQAEIGISQSSMNSSDYEYAAINFSSTYQISKSVRFNFEMEARAKAHNTGTEYSYLLNGYLQKNNWEFGMGFIQYSGEIDNHVVYNIPSRRDGQIDPVIMMYGTYRFGSKNSNTRIKERQMINSREWLRPD